MADHKSVGMSSDVDDNGMEWFTNAIRSNEETPNLPREFRHRAQDMDISRPRIGLHRQRSNNLGSTLGDQDLSYFDFEPYYCGSPSRESAVATNGTQQHGSIQNKESLPISPPNSAIFASPNPWPSSDYNLTYLPEILTTIDSANARSQYGQVTPPDDESSDFAKQGLSQLQPACPNKRKKVAVRHRKNAARSLNGDSQAIDPDDPRYTKRSKFLERNRLAASKCRQKKKSWVESLETKARELLALNNALGPEIASLKCELLHMKLEIVKHRSCDGPEIQELMKQDSEYFFEAFQILEDLKEKKPDASTPESPNNNIEPLLRQFQKDAQDTTAKENSSPHQARDRLFDPPLRGDCAEDESHDGPATAS